MSDDDMDDLDAVPSPIVVENGHKHDRIARLEANLTLLVVEVRHQGRVLAELHQMLSEALKVK